ncbi:hypothetical protein PCANC_09132 [Puccinia coronata f. sp. avenae]|uniref:Uncharacterized protein n=1 Tax=Puccinia coronata f. sp. avenae TaxID=200324 RepID=A0A2N5T1H9_9BASI|nr:hypothetical protein PCANC_09132 [Puccinia coronata f. sp. avenae]
MGEIKTHPVAREKNSSRPARATQSTQHPLKNESRALRINTRTDEADRYRSRLILLVAFFILKMPRVSNDMQVVSSKSRANGNEQALVISARPVKRLKTGDPTDDISLSEFLDFCHIPPDDPHVWALIKKHQIHHWSAFKGVSSFRLESILKFEFGPAQLIEAGAERLEKMTPQQLTLMF